MQVYVALNDLDNLEDLERRTNDIAYTAETPGTMLGVTHWGWNETVPHFTGDMFKCTLLNDNYRILRVTLFQGHYFQVVAWCWDITEWCKRYSIRLFIIYYKYCMIYQQVWVGLKHSLLVISVKQLALNCIPLYTGLCVGRVDYIAYGLCHSSSSVVGDQKVVCHTKLKYAYGPDHA